uniref:SXP/RAL-2 family protein Ani s 5-like cation-binding domain-containing protein n=1 Tax=Parascaris univalens TaxID=6257 RepID=A0A915AR95_PARUN
IFVVAVIAWFVADGTTVNAQPFGDPELHRGFHGHGPISHAQIQTSSEHPGFRFFGICSRPRRHWYRRLPDFLKNVTREGFKEFCDIVKNENLTKAQIEQQLKEWAQKQGGDVGEQFSEFVEKKKQKWSEIQQKVEELIANVSQFIGEVETIHDDVNLTRREEKEKVFDLVKATKPAVLAVAMKIGAQLGLFFNGHGRRPCPGCGFPYPPPRFPYHGPHFDPRIFEGEPQFPGDDSGPFGEDGPFEHNGPYRPNRNPPQIGSFGPSGDPWQRGPFGSNGRQWQGGPFEGSRNPPQDEYLGQNSPYERYGSFGGRDEHPFENDAERERPEVAVIVI